MDGFADPSKPAVSSNHAGAFLGAHGTSQPVTHGAAAAAGHSDCVLRGDGGFQLVVDPVAVSFLRGAQIDFVDDGVNSSFVFNNVFQAIGGRGACGGCGGGAF